MSTFHDDGFLLLRDVIPAEAVDGIRLVYAEATDRILRQLHDEGLIDDTAPDEPLERRLVAAGEHAGRFGRGWRRMVAAPQVYDLHFAPKLLEHVEEILGPEIRGHSVYNARPKLPRQQLTVVPWHQDSGYFGPQTETSTIPAVWIPVVPVSADNGGMQVARGSHRRGLIAHDIEEREGRFLELEGVEPDPSEVVTCEMEPGDALLIHNLAFHRSLPNTTDGIRWSVDIRYYAEGDEPGGQAEFPEPFVVRSRTLPPTPRDTWLEWARSLPW